MAQINDVKEGAKFQTTKESSGKGRVGVAYAVKESETEFVNLFFEGPGCVVAGENYMPPTGRYNIDSLILVD